jgi:hypothetical protein
MTQNTENGHLVSKAKLASMVLEFLERVEQKMSRVTAALTILVWLLISLVPFRRSVR